MCSSDLGGAGEDWLELSSWTPDQGDQGVVSEGEGEGRNGDGPIGDALNPGTAWPEGNELAGSPRLLEGIELRGGEGRDRFILPGLEGAWPALAEAAARRPCLVDLTLVAGDDGSLQLSDRLAYRSLPPFAGAMPGEPADAGLLEPTPCGAEGVGDIRLLPIAPLEQLLAGISPSTPQLAIATAAEGSALVLLGPAHTSLELASLPSLRQPATGCVGSNGGPPIQAALASAAAG
mgnify:FL=1